jgi:LysR family transcriptional regulator, glycine cleavage system transcriptional activator
MAPLPLNALRAFAAIYASGGVRPAARELAISHSAVSRHLGELERWLGVKLLQPTSGRRGVVFTAQGDALGKVAIASLGELARVAEALREARSERTVAIATSPSIAVRWLLPRLPALEAAHRSIDVSVVVDQRVQDLAAAGADLAIRSGKGPWPEVEHHALMTDALYPVMSPALHARVGRPSRPAALARLRLLHDRDPDATWEAWRAAHGPRGLDVRRGPRYTSSDLVLRAAVHGQGVALARHRLARDDVAAGALIRPFGDLEVDLGVAYWIVRPVHVHPTAATAAVVRWLLQHAELDEAGV